jgi:hypothetical protein
MFDLNLVQNNFFYQTGGSMIWYLFQFNTNALNIDVQTQP